MATVNPTAPAAPFDPVEEARQLADMYYDASDAVDKSLLRFHPPLSDEDAKPFEDASAKLEDRGDDFTAEGIAAILAGVQTDLTRIKALTKDATEQLKTLTDVGRVFTIATLVVNLGTAIVKEDPKSILAAVEALGDGLAGVPPAAPASSSSPSSPAATPAPTS